MRCQKRGIDNREGARFCSECAAPLSAKCARCGMDNAPGVKFCDSAAARPVAYAREHDIYFNASVTTSGWQFDLFFDLGPKLTRAAASSAKASHSRNSQYAKQLSED